MLEDLLEDSWTFRRLRERAEQKGIAIGEQKGVEKGRIQMLMENLQSFVELRFPDLLPLMDEYSQTSLPENVLKALVIQVGLAQSVTEARHLLLAALHSNE